MLSRLFFSTVGTIKLFSFITHDLSGFIRAKEAAHDTDRSVTEDTTGEI